VPALVAGPADPTTRAAGATGRLRTTRPRLAPALTGWRRDQHRRWWTGPWAHLDGLAAPSDARRMESRRGLGALAAAAWPTLNPAGTTGEGTSAGDQDAPGPARPCATAIAGLDPSPGVGQRGAARLVAEWDTAMRCVGTTSRLSAWAGVAPGQDARASPQRSGKTRPGHRTLRTGLPHIAHAAARTQGPSRSAWYQRLAARRGSKRAIMAVAHAMVVRAFPRLSRHEPDHDLGATYVAEPRRHHLVDRLTRRSPRLGSHVHLDLAQTVSQAIFNGRSHVIKKGSKGSIGFSARRSPIGKAIRQ
jgi:transposase